jgi:hypothetical protein
LGFKVTLNTTVATFVPAVADRLSAGEVKNMHYGEPPRHALGTLYEASEAAIGVAGMTHGSGGVEAN